jgi:hypothetical protein
MVMTSSWVLRYSKGHGVAALLVAAACTNGCRSGLHSSQPRDAALGPGADATPLGGFVGSGGAGTPATGGSATGGRATGGEATGGSGAGSVGRDGSGDTGTGGQGGGFDGGAADTGAGNCAAIADQLASQTAVVGTCTAVVRLDYSTLAILSHAFVCGEYSTRDETAARRTASTDAAFPPGSVGDGQLLSGPNPADEWVLFQPPRDFGGVAAVSARSGLTVFAGSIVWQGTGYVTVPSTWSMSDLGSGCAHRARPLVRGFDLSQEGATARFDEAADVVLGTALPSAFEHWGYIFDVVVLLYPRTVGGFDPATAEYIVLVNAGWLE